jgi:diguanylate cyclase (GGDEF)-like protein
MQPQPGHSGTESAEHQSSEVLLEAVTDCITHILKAASLREGLPQALQMIGTVVRIDRMVVIEAIADGSNRLRPRVFFVWSSEDAPKVDAAAIIAQSQAHEAMQEEWLKPLKMGNVAIGVRRLLIGPMRDLLTQLQVVSTLQVPIMLNGIYSGQIVFDDCKGEHEWTRAQINILKLLAEFIGTAAERERTHEDLRYRDLLLAAVNSAVVDIMTSRDLDAAITAALQKVATAVRADRMLVVEIPQTASGDRHPVVKNIWTAPDLSVDLAAVLEMLDEPMHPEVLSWAAPLQAGRAVRARVGTASAGHRQFLERLKVKSALLVPIMTDGKCWGHISFDDCRGEREWSDTEVDILTSLAQLIGTAIERKLAEERIALLARTDGLTGLANRTTFNDRLWQAFSAAQRGANPFALIYIDLDRFKDVNDMHGHATGDRLLKAVAQRLRAATRETDCIARLGGDEFALLQTDVIDTALPGTLATSIIATLSEPYPMDSDHLRIGASAGITVYSAEVTTPETLLAQADHALYRAKDEGRGQFRFHSEELDRVAREYASLAEGLRNALARGELELYYQSQVELSSGRIVGMEALLRWNHPTRGLLLPGVFMPIAEKSSVIQALGRWVLDGACRQLAQWRKEAVPVPLIAVNVSLGQLKAGKDLVRDIKETLARWELAPGDLELDVTESALVKTTMAQSDVLGELRQLGVSIAIDDFGAEYSSLDYVRTYRVSRLKIARQMVAAASDPGGGQAMIRAIVALAAELGVEVVAEGVETEAQRAALVKMSSKAKGQGYYFSRPMSAEDTTLSLRLTLGRPSSDDP